MATIAPMGGYSPQGYNLYSSSASSRAVAPTPTTDSSSEQPETATNNPNVAAGSTPSQPQNSYGLSDTQRVSQTSATPTTELDEQALAQVRELSQIDREVRQHERAHQSAGGSLAGNMSLDYQRGPDGNLYAVAGEVSIDTSAGATPEETINRAETIIAAANAPANPSAQDRAVAADARAMANQARAELVNNSEGDAENPLSNEPFNDSLDGSLNGNGNSAAFALNPDGSVASVVTPATGRVTTGSSSAATQANASSNDENAVDVTEINSAAQTVIANALANNESNRADAVQSASDVSSVMGSAGNVVGNQPNAMGAVDETNAEDSSVTPMSPDPEMMAQRMEEQQQSLEESHTAQTEQMQAYQDQLDQIRDRVAEMNQRLADAGVLTLGLDSGIMVNDEV